MASFPLLSAAISFYENRHNSFCSWIAFLAGEGKEEWSTNNKETVCWRLNFKKESGKRKLSSSFTHRTRGKFHFHVSDKVSLFPTVLRAWIWNKRYWFADCCKPCASLLSRMVVLKIKSQWVITSFIRYWNVRRTLTLGNNCKFRYAIILGFEVRRRRDDHNKYQPTTNCNERSHHLQTKCFALQSISGTEKRSSWWQKIQFINSVSVNLPKRIDPIDFSLPSGDFQCSQTVQGLLRGSTFSCHRVSCRNSIGSYSCHFCCRRLYLFRWKRRREMESGQCWSICVPKHQLLAFYGRSRMP